MPCCPSSHVTMHAFAGFIAMPATTLGALAKGRSIPSNITLSCACPFDPTTPSYLPHCGHIVLSKKCSIGLIFHQQSVHERNNCRQSCKQAPIFKTLFIPPQTNLTPCRQVLVRLQRRRRTMLLEPVPVLHCTLCFLPIRAGGDSQSGRMFHKLSTCAC